MNLGREDISNLEERYRRNLINSLLGPKSIVLVGTRSSANVNNLAPFSQVFHVGANPPLAGILFRPDSVPRHTLLNIRESGFYTIQSVHAHFYEKAHQCSARYPENVSEFDAAGLEAEFIDGFPAPFVQSSVVKLALEFAEEIKIASNNTILVIGEIQKIILPEENIETDGFVNPSKTGAIAAAGLDSYFHVNELSRLNYAKP